MTFEKLHEGTSCNCVTEIENSVMGLFIKKIDGPELREKDFFSYWEKGKTPERDACDDICSYKGVSIDFLESEGDIARMMEVYKRTLSIKPKGKTKYITFNIKLDGGLTKHTPTSASPTHHDFYKCDAFTIDAIQVDKLGPIE